MKGELIRVWTEDELQLQGLYCAPQENKGLPAVLHIHGASSNFYRSQFLDPLAEELAKRGAAFLTGNTRGHDIMNSVYTSDPTASRRLGGAFEIFEESPLDIAAWLDFLQRHGHREMVLLGHSFGAHKAAFYCSETSDERIRGLIFMSPADQGLWVDAMGPEAERTLSWAIEKVSSGQGEALLDDGPAPYPMSACTIHSLFVTARPDIFRFGRPGDRWEVVSKLGCPILATMGTVAEFISTTPDAALATLKAKAVSSPRCDTVVLKGAPHNYRGHEEEVTRVIVGWLGDVFGV
ncbi:MAG: alpha/beta hydrolase [Anaerolineae bacterium]|nr:alpha/beta hydrolase [Anaerolineae bacterium]